MEQSFDRTCLHVTIPLEWTPVLDAKGQPADCHTKGLKRTKTLRNFLVGPQVYRWVVRDANRNIVAVYIGETGNVRNRLALYRNGHKKENDTVNHVKRQFESSIAKGHIISLELVTFASFTVNGALISMKRLSDPAIRKFLENLAILEAQAKSLKIINRDKDVQLKTLEKLFAKLSAEEQMKFADLLMADHSKQVDGKIDAA